EKWAKLVEKTQKELGMSKKLMPLKELDEIASSLAEISNDALKRYCNRTGMGDGFWLCKTVKLDELDAFITKRLLAITEVLVPMLEAKYEDECAKVREVWGDEIASQLPAKSELKGLFNVRMLPLTLAVPDVNAEAKARFEAQMMAECEAARDTVIAPLL